MEENIAPVENELPGVAKNGNRGRLFEMAAVILVMVAPSMASWGCNLLWDGEYQQYRLNQRKAEYQSSLTYNVASFNDTFLHLRYVPVILFVMWRSGDGWDRFGFVRPKLRKDVLIGIALAFVIIFVDESVYSLLGIRHGWRFRWDRFYPSPVPVSLEMLLIGRCLAVGLSEELLARSYLIPRLEDATESSAWAVIVSSVLFGLLHSNQGALRVVLISFSGFLWGVTFCKTRRIWPLVLSHAIIDYIAFTHSGAFAGM
jgi:membrane protease YdiL (CAAX protease family)